MFKYMYDIIKRIKRLPPILYPFGALIRLIINIIKLILWLVGFWKCDYCDRTHWITTGREEHYSHDYLGHIEKKLECDICKVERELTGKKRI